MTKSLMDDATTIMVTLRHSNNHASIEEYARNAAAGLSKVHSGRMNCHVILDHQKNDYERNKLAELTVHIPQHDFVARESAPTYEQAIDACIDNMSRQLQKHKERVRNI